MEKISRILPPSRRVVSVDVESSQPVRPGAPDHGRPTKKTLDVQDRVSFSSLAASRTPEPANYKNIKETNRAKVVDEIAEKFFNPRTIAKEGEGPKSEETLKRIEENQGFSQAVAPKVPNPSADEKSPIGSI